MPDGRHATRPQGQVPCHNAPVSKVRGDGLLSLYLGEILPSEGYAKQQQTRSLSAHPKPPLFEPARAYPVDAEGLLCLHPGWVLTTVTGWWPAPGQHTTVEQETGEGLVPGKKRAKVSDARRCS